MSAHGRAIGGSQPLDRERELDELLPHDDAAPRGFRTALVFLAAFSRGFTYDVRRNPYTWVGFAWGLPIPLLALDVAIGDGFGIASRLGTAGLRVLATALLVHPLLFAVVFGAFGTVRHDLGESNRRLIERLRQMALTDPLTGLHNRRFVIEMLKHEIFSGSRTGKGCAVALFDLDDFKAVNDHHGHQAGDALLREVGRALRTVVRRSDVVGRYGGDEFLLVTSESDRARAAAERVRGLLLRRSGVRLSVAMATCPEDGGEASDLIRVADQRLAEEKRKKKLGRARLLQSNPGNRRSARLELH